MGKRASIQQHFMATKKALFALAGFLVAGSILWLFLTHCPVGEATYCNYKKIKIGMSLTDVESFLGPGEEIEPAVVPKYTDFSEDDPKKRLKPVVTGDIYYRWFVGSPYMGTRIIVGLERGRVSSKNYREPSL